MHGHFHFFNNLPRWTNIFCSAAFILSTFVGAKSVPLTSKLTLAAVYCLKDELNKDIYHEESAGFLLEDEDVQVLARMVEEALVYSCLASLFFTILWFRNLPLQSVNLFSLK